jgi:opacity protein-like surface antigen
MKRFIGVLVASLLPLAASAQWSRDLTLVVSTGVSVPMSGNDLSKNFQVDTTMNSFAATYSTNGLTFLFSDVWTAGFNLSAGAEYAYTPDLSFQLSVNYHSFHLDKTKIRAAVGLPGASSVDDADLIAVAVSAGAKYRFLDADAPVVPYALAGVGIMNLAADDIYVLVDTYHNLTYHFNATNALHATVGAGVDVLGGESSSLFLEAKLDMGFTKHGMMYYLPIRIGFRGAF